MTEVMKQFIIYGLAGVVGMGLLLAGGKHFSGQAWAHPQASHPQASQPQSNQNMQSNKNMKTIHLTKSEFLEKVVNYEKQPDQWNYLGDKPALIDFYADWCGPCKRLSPELERLAQEYDGQIYIYKIDTEQEQELAAVFGIRTIPTLIFVPMKGEPQVAHGALPREDLKKAIDEILLAK